MQTNSWCLQDSLPAESPAGRPAAVTPCCQYGVRSDERHHSVTLLRYYRRRRGVHLLQVHPDGLCDTTGRSQPGDTSVCHGSGRHGLVFFCLFFFLLVHFYAKQASHTATGDLGKVENMSAVQQIWGTCCVTSSAETGGVLSSDSAPNK